MSSILLLALQLGAVAGGFLGMSRAIGWYHDDEGKKRSNKSGGGNVDGKPRHL